MCYNMQPYHDMGPKVSFWGFYPVGRWNVVRDVAFISAFRHSGIPVWDVLIGVKDLVMGVMMLCSLWVFERDGLLRKGSEKEELEEMRSSLIEV